MRARALRLVSVAAAAWLLLLSGLAAADGPALTASGPGGKEPGTAKEGQLVLHSQITEVVEQSAAAQTFEEAYRAHDCQAADDFTVTVTGGWEVDQVRILALYPTSGPAAAVEYAFYADAAGQPGETVCSGTATIVSDSGGDILASLPGPCALAQGAYWFGASLSMSLESAGQAYWHMLSAPRGSEAQWRNPGGGFGSACLDWCGLSELELEHSDLAFELLGSTGPG